jgi:hypothetical protein
MTPVPSSSRLVVGCLHNHYLVAGEQCAAEELRDRLERSVAADLVSALARSLEHTLNPDDQSVWFVRRLALDFPLNAEIEPGHAAAVFAKQIAEELLLELRAPNSGDVIRFPDRAAYLAQFLLDLAEGAAWDKWYYESFAGFRALSVTAALRSAILDDPEAGLHALNILGEKAFTIARALCPADAARVLSGLSAGRSAGIVAEFVSAIANASAGTLPVSDRDEQGYALLLFLSTVKSYPSLNRRLVAEVSGAIARLRRCVAQGSLFLNELQAGGDPAALYRALGPEHAAMLAPLLAAGGAMFDSLLAPSLAAHPQPEKPATAYTHFGGMFLLLPSIDELPLTGESVGWPDPVTSDGRTSAAALVRFLILVKCLGGRQAFGCAADPLVRESMDIPSDLEWPSIAAWSHRVRPEHLERFLDALLAWHQDTGAAIGPPFEFARARRRGAPEIFEVDPARGIWIRRASVLPAEVSHAATRDFDYLAFPRALGVRRAVDIALSIAAQGVLRCFAWKLPGFSQSSLPYLSANFLNCTAAVESQPGRMVVRIGRTPLNLILGMTGLNCCMYSVSWKELPYALFPEG